MKVFFIESFGVSIGELVYPAADVSEQIFDATDRLMAKEGLHYLSMHKLAKEAGIAAGTIYLYFKSKDELLAQFARRVFNKFAVAIEEGFDELGVKFKTSEEVIVKILEERYSDFSVSPMSFVVERLTASIILWVSMLFLLLLTLFMIKKEYREEIYLVALVLLGLYLSLIENIIPKPFPWMKIGLSNISVLIALEKFNSKMALQTILLRVFIQALMLGTLFTPNFIISFSAGLISTLFMIFLYKFRKYLSLLSISCISAFTHNLLQLIVVYFLLFRNISLNSKSIIIFIILMIATYLFMKTPAFGALPSGKSLEKVKASKNYVDGEFKNKESTELLTDTKKTPIKRLLEFAFEKDPEGTVPDFDLPSIKTDLKNLDPSEDVMVWFGHSSLFIQISGKKVLVDPVFSKYAS